MDLHFIKIKWYINIVNIFINDHLFNTTMNNNKKIQEERIKRYFVDATKSILKGEGLKSVNVRNIAKEAGYSYATLYNYFKDVKDLVFECVKDFQSECEQIVHAESKNSKHGPPRIKKMTSSYIKYFVQYPGIFELFYLEGINDLGYKSPVPKTIYYMLDKLCEEEWNYCNEKNIYSKKVIDLKKETLRNVTAGILLFYLNRYNPQDYKEFVEIVDRQLTTILN